MDYRQYCMYIIVGDLAKRILPSFYSKDGLYNNLQTKDMFTLNFQCEGSDVYDLFCTDVVGGNAAVLTRVREFKVTKG